MKKILQRILVIRWLALIVLLGLAGCATHDPLKDDIPADELYKQGKEALDEGRYYDAADKFELLESRYPFGPLSQQGQLDLIFVYYKLNDSASALASADRFIRLYPNHPHVDYAYYMRGLINFNIDKSVLQKMFNTDFSQRDAGSSRQSFQDFSALLKRFPESDYANDARKRMIFLRNSLAEYELHVARYYMERGAYLAAANRAKYVVENYPQSPANIDALKLMVSAYKILGLDELAENAHNTLRFNFPEAAPMIE
jgi:outer membrane protein assembly factor BamD|tara:strand:+ start:845 stop:1612 length:768 start_codon:yes stop_codon:yes gene_type:complete